MADKTFINGVFIREHQFKDGGSILKVSIALDKVDSLCEQLKFNARKDGLIRLQIWANKKPTIGKEGRVIATHSLSVDTWEPSQGKAAPAKASEAPHDGGASDVPF